MNALEINGLTKSFPGFTLDNISFTLPNGCILGLVGENGAGKSTTIKLILDMLHKDGGSIKVFGKDNTVRSSARGYLAVSRPSTSTTAHAPGSR